MGIEENKMICKEHGKTIVNMLQEGVDSMPCSGCGEDVRVPMHTRRANSKLDFDNLLFLNNLKSELKPRRNGK